MEPATADKLDDISHVNVEDNGTLTALCERWRERPCLAVDTEFVRTDTFYPRVGLIQICDGEDNYLIDPLAIDDWEAFRRLMVDPGVLKVFHSCSEDLLVFLALLDVIPRPLFDTQIAAAFLDAGLSLSYRNLVREMMGVDLPKGETRSDWLQRPLTEEQQRYAALDVVWLLDVHARQSARLGREGKLDWLREECDRCVGLYDTERSGDFSDYYRGIKGAWQLRPRELAVLQKLAEWREQRARRRDKPRNWIIRDQQLVDLARVLPGSREELAAVPGIRQSFIKHEGTAVLRLVREVCEAPEESYPAAMPGPLTGSQKKRLQAARAWVNNKARELGVNAELLARKRILLPLLQAVAAFRRVHPDAELDADAVAVPEELTGWRRELLLQELLRIFDGR